MVFNSGAKQNNVENKSKKQEVGVWIYRKKRERRAYMKEINI